MKWIIPAYCAVVLSLTAGAATAQQMLEDLPGYFPDEYLDLLQPEDTSVEINLQGAMLKMIGAFAGTEDPGFAELVSSLDGIRVRSGEPSSATVAEIRERVHSAERWLTQAGWMAMIRVREEGDEVYVYSKELDGLFVGFTILAVEDSEVTTVNLIGRLDPTQLIRIAEGLDLGVFDDLDADFSSLSGGTDD